MIRATLVFEIIWQLFGDFWPCRINTIYVHCRKMQNLFALVAKPDRKTRQRLAFPPFSKVRTNKLYIFQQCTYRYCVYPTMPKSIVYVYVLLTEIVHNHVLKRQVWTCSSIILHFFHFPVQFKLNFILFLGNVWVYRTYNDWQRSDSTRSDYCDPTLYYFAFWMITSSYIIAGILCFGGIIFCIVLCCCCAEKE